MATLTQPVGPSVDWLDASTVAEVLSSASGLRVVLAGGGGGGCERFLEVHFPFARAFQAMDEGDMVGMINADLAPGHAVFEVLGNGWHAAARDRFLYASTGVKEWLIVSGLGPMVSVLSSYTPHVREYGSGA